MFDDDEHQSSKLEMGTILQGFKVAVERALQETIGAIESIPVSSVAASVPQEKTLKEIIEERENELKELE